MCNTDITPIDISPRDKEFLRQREIIRRKIIDLYRIPSSILGKRILVSKEELDQLLEGAEVKP